MKIYYSLYYLQKCTTTTAVVFDRQNASCSRKLGMIAYFLYLGWLGYYYT